MNQKKKRDLILIGCVLAAAFILYLVNLLIFSKPAVMVEVSVNGQTIESYDLNQNMDITIPGANGGTNHLVIQNGEAYIADASCPDGLCIHQGKIHKNGEMLVCLPNQMIAKIVGGGE